MALPSAWSSPSPSPHRLPPSTPSSPSSRPSLPGKTPSAATAAAMPSYFGARLASPNVSAQAQRTPSPNYFQYHASDANHNSDSVQHHAKSNWSPPSSAVRSTAAASPSVLPVDQNPEFNAFRKQSEGKAFNLGGLNTGFNSGPAPTSTPNQHKHARTSSKTLSPVKEPLKGMDMNLSSRPRKASIAAANLDPSTAELSRSPKRVLSPGSLMHSDIARKVSPATLYNSEGARPQSQPRFDLPLDSPSTYVNLPKVPRAETLPAGPDVSDAQLFTTPQHVVNLLESKPEDVLLLDLRVSAHYASSHITGALSLCIPTTLLKRPSFNVQKLAETFKDEEHRSKFEKWRRCTHIIVYDAASAQLKDAQICINTIKKFRSEGFEDAVYIIKGGFKEFSSRFSAYIDEPSERSDQDTEAQGPNVAPVVGGCLMPGTDKPANPFFGNIRQNMDLIGGVGQIALTHPKKSSKHTDVLYPQWLSSASEDVDQGKAVSNKFLAIERREKKRMEDALSGHVSWTNSPSQQGSSTKDVRIAGIEKGSKNRYNNIWPFEHSRVRLQGVPKNECDYFNANFVQASLSNKRYISTQAPIPATFTDFWSVVWQQDVRVIVMLTAEQEGAQVKAHNYWAGKRYGPYLLEFLSEKRASLEPARIHRSQKQRPTANKRMSTSSTLPQIPLAPITSTAAEDKDQPYVIVRKFTLSHQNRPFEPMREITQLQYSSWPDFGAPAHPAHVLGLVEQTEACVRASNKISANKTGSSSSDRPSLGTRTFSSEPEAANPRPILVHCSAGCGRTGTFCTIDSVIDMLKRQRAFRNRSTQERGDSADMKMDVDETTPARDLAVQDRDPAPNKQQGSDDFFMSQASDKDAGGINGRWIRSDDLDLVERTVEDFRHQRLSMVQSLRQFVLCYESVMEWLVEQERSPDSA